MSIAREVKVKFDLDRLAKAAQSIGLRVHRDAQCMGYYSEAMANGKRFPLVIETGQGSRFQIGVDENGITTDMHGGYVQGKLNELLPAYYGEMAADAGFQVTEQTENAEEIVLHVSR